MIDRTSHFWGESFHIAFAEILRRVPASESLLMGPKWAEHARNLADDCERARLGIGEQPAPPHDACQGVGCEACHWSGKAGGAPLVAPMIAVPTIPVEAPPGREIATSLEIAAFEGDSAARELLDDLTDSPRAASGG